jgi:translation initiation factor IF-2
LAKRVFEIAKDLGIDSRAIMAKCWDEGISKDQIKGHMSTVSIGLEATIREWFSDGAHTTTVEQAQRVDLEKARVKPKRARTKTVDGDAEAPPPDASASATAVAEPPARSHSAPQEPEGPSGSEGNGGGVSVAEPPESVAAPKAKPRPAVPPAPPPEAPPVAKAAPKAPEIEADAPRAEPIARKIDHPKVEPPAPPAPPSRSEAIRPAQMNVPTRPKVIKPAGPMLQVQAPVKLSGPKVVRVEAPEAVAAPRPRRGPVGNDSPVPGSRGPRTGTGIAPGGTGAGTGSSDDDRGRSPRRGVNKRRTSSGTGVPARRRGSAAATELPGGAAGIFSEQDLIEREARLQRSGGFLKKHRQDLKKAGQAGAERAMTAAETGGVVKIVAPFTIKDLSAATGVKGADIVKKLFLQGVMATINSGIETAKAQEIMIDYDIELEVIEAKTAEELVSSSFEKKETVDLRPRGPVVTILGHVDHGKTSLLDKIRNANVAAGEAGGITQRTSAFRVPLTVAGEQKQVVFLDTPGHQAFTSMRSRGANMTDVVVLVVSAPEGVMPQTIESINHARAAKVPIVVALNKIDRPDATEAQVQKTLRALADAGINPVEWGGDTEVVRTSATTGQGIPELLETLDYQAQLKELKADFGGKARGIVIEAKVESGRGSVANILVQDGTLKVGDFIVAGRAFGRVRDMTDDRGNKLLEATPPMPVQISGVDEVADAGDKFYVVDSLKKAQEAAEQRRDRERHSQLAQPKVTLDNIFSHMAENAVKEILVVLKAAEQGTVDVLKNECERVKTEEVKVRVLHGAVGGITESDVLLADASKAIIIGFNVIPSGKARQLAEQKGVEIRTYQVIYDITDDLRKAAEGLLAPELRQEILGHAEVRAVFKVTKVGNIAGCYITDGVVQRDALIRVTRNGVVVENDRKLAQLKRLKDDAKEVRAGMECGMKIDGYDDIKEGDVLECYKSVEVKRTL